MSTTLITGATGFVGRQLAVELMRLGVAVRAPIRDAGGARLLPPGVNVHVTGDLTAIDSFDELLQGVDTVMHLAARAHVTTDRGGENADLYRTNNELLTQRLAQAARACGVRRFVMVSSIKVFGEVDRGRPFRADDAPAPADAYGRSKLNAENALRDACAGGGMAAVIVRPPLVYGPQVRANFLRIMRLVDRELPLPLAAVRNRRSMVSSANLVDFLCRCREHAAAAGAVLLVSDCDDLSTPDLVRKLAHAMRRRCRLFSVPVPVLRGLAGIAGYGAELARLTDSLSVDIEASRARLQWTPPLTVAAGMAATVGSYLQARGE